MVRTPCCKAEGLKKGAWTTEEDQKLIAYIQEHGEGGWRTLPEKAGLRRCGKSCRLRWANYLRPDIKRGEFSAEEEDAIIKLHAIRGNKWSSIARCLPGRTDNEIKNYWNTHIKKRLMREGTDSTTHKPTSDHSAPKKSADEASEKSVSHQPSPLNPVSSSARLLNKAAAKLAIKANQKALSEIIGGRRTGTVVQYQATTNESTPVSKSVSSTSNLLNKVTNGSDILRAIFSGANSGHPHYLLSTSTSSFSDEAFDTVMPHSDSAFTIDPLPYAHLQGLSVSTEATLNDFDVSDFLYHSSGDNDLNSLELPELLNSFSDERFALDHSINTEKTDEDHLNVINFENSGINNVAEEISSCWNDELGFEDLRSLKGFTLQ